jgi:hypothetical protein
MEQTPLGQCRVCKHGLTSALVDYLIEDYRDLVPFPRSRLALFTKELVATACPDHLTLLVALAAYLRWWVVYEDEIGNCNHFAHMYQPSCPGCVAFSRTKDTGTEVEQCFRPDPFRLCPYNPVCDRLYRRDHTRFTLGLEPLEDQEGVLWQFRLAHKVLIEVASRSGLDSRHIPPPPYWVPLSNPTDPKSLGVEKYLIEDVHSSRTSF